MAITVTDYQPDDTIAIDTYIDQANPTTNYGTAQGLWVGKDASGNTNSVLLSFRWIWQGLAGANTPGANKKMKFTTDLKLSLYVSGNYAAGLRYFRMRYIKRNWTESGVNWNTYDGTNAWATAGGLGAADSDVLGLTDYHGQFGNLATSTWYDFIIPVGYLQQEMAGIYFGILLDGSIESSAGNGSAFNSSSHTTVSTRPKYSFSYEPYHKIFQMNAGAILGAK